MSRIKKTGLTWLHYIRDTLDGVSDRERDYEEWKRQREIQTHQMTNETDPTTTKGETAHESNEHDENRYCEYD